MSRILYSLCILFLIGCSQNKEETDDKTNVSGTTEVPYFVQMANSDIKRNPDPRLLDFRDKPKWEYTNGLICTAMLKVWRETGDKTYFNYAKSYADSMINEKGEIATYKQSDYNIDRVNPGKFLIELYKETGDGKYRLAIETLRDQMRKHPRTSEGGFWHKKRYPHQMWLDGLYMGSPFLAQYAVEFDEPALFEDVARQIILIDKYAWNEEKGLYHHGWDESRKQKWANPETGLSPNIWGRAMGWFSMALVDVLDYFPEDHPKRKEILRVTKKMAGAIAEYQDEKTGLWWQVVDQGDREGNYLESSASSMFVYFLLKATRNGYIDQEFLNVARKGYDGIVKNFITREKDGTLSITNVCSVAGLGGDPYRDGTYEYYINEKRRDNDPKAVGPFIMASLEMEQLKEGNKITLK